MIEMEQDNVYLTEGGGTRPTGQGLPKLNMRDTAPDPQALQVLPEAVARRFKVIPLSLQDNVLRVYMANPNDVLTIENLEIYTKKRIQPVAAEEADILEAIGYNYKAAQETSMGEGAVLPQLQSAAPDNQAAPDMIMTDMSVTEVLKKRLEEAIKARASDVHIEPEDNRVRVRFRIDGILQEVSSFPLSMLTQVISRIKILSNMNIADHRRPQDGQFTFESGEKKVDIRVATVNTVNGEMAVLRLLDKSFAAIELRRLGFLPESQDKFEKMLTMPYGMVLVSGPTGAGKTTTLYAAINSLDCVGRKIITIEDPVEYRFQHINQIQVNVKAGLSFAAGLRSIVRLDPDVILVGEIRDSETAQIAVQSALTGHLMLSSVHANDTVGVIFRLIDLGVERFLISSALVGIVAQRMVRRVCPHCARKVTAPLVEQMAYESATGEGQTDFAYGEGCRQCLYTGYLGRIALFETLMINDEIRTMIVKGAGNAELREQALRSGLVTVARDGMRKAKAGVTTPYEVLRNAYSVI